MLIMVDRLGAQSDGLFCVAFLKTAVAKRRCVAEGSYAIDLRSLHKWEQVCSDTF